MQSNEEVDSTALVDRCLHGCFQYRDLELAQDTTKGREYGSKGYKNESTKKKNGRGSMNPRKRMLTQRSSHQLPREQTAFQFLLQRRRSSGRNDQNMVS